MVEHQSPERQQGTPYQVLLFALPKEPAKQNAAQDKFFLDAAFWKHHIAGLLLWTRPLAITKTETPEGEPAVALLVGFTDFDDILYKVGRDIAQELELPAFALTLTFLDDDMLEDLKSAPKPWTATELEDQ